MTFAVATTAMFVLVATAATAQEQTVPIGEPVASGVSYYRFAEPGAPTFEAVFVGNGVRAGIYRFEEGTSLVRALALAGGTASSDSTANQITTTTIRVLRPQPEGDVRPIYETTSQRLVQEVSRHPELRNGDLVESRTTVEIIEEDGFTFIDGLEVAGRLASITTAVILLIVRLQ